MSSSTSKRKGGIATLSIDGVAYDVVSEAQYLAAKVKRESLIGQSGVHGFSEMPQAQYISATIRDNGSLSTGSLNQLTDSVLVLTLANGKTVYGDGMWNTEFEAVNTQEGTFSIRFEGDNVIEQTV